MRPLLLIILHTFVLTLGVYAQETEIPCKDISEKDLREQGVRLVNQFAIIVRGLEHCPPNPLLENSLDIFDPDAIIEVAGARSSIKRYTPESYLRVITALKCGQPPVYKQMHFDYRPVAPEDGVVTRFNGIYTVAFNVKQTFTGSTNNGNNLYADLTVKVITVIARKDNTGAIQAKIIGVVVEEMATQTK